MPQKSDEARVGERGTSEDALHGVTNGAQGNGSADGQQAVVVDDLQKNRREIVRVCNKAISSGKSAGLMLTPLDVARYSPSPLGKWDPNIGQVDALELPELDASRAGSPSAGAAMTARRTLPNRRKSRTFEFEHGGLTYVASVSFFENGGLGEMFLRAGKTGSAAEIGAHDGAIILSISLQYGVPLAAIQHALMKLGDGAAAGPIGRALDIVEAGAYA